MKLAYGECLEIVWERLEDFTGQSETDCRIRQSGNRRLCVWLFPYVIRR
jgi:hypothetical protein